MTVSEAIRELRRHRGESQQTFATSLKMSLRALQMYEGGKPPQLKQLMVFLGAAQRAGRSDIAEVLGHQIHSDFAQADPFASPIDTFPADDWERTLMNLVLRCVRWPDARRFGSEIVFAVIRAHQTVTPPEELAGPVAGYSEYEFRQFLLHAIERGLAQMATDGRIVAPGEQGMTGAPALKVQMKQKQNNKKRKPDTK